MLPNDDDNRLVPLAERYRRWSSEVGRDNEADRCWILYGEQLKYKIFFMTFHTKQIEIFDKLQNEILFSGKSEGNSSKDILNKLLVDWYPFIILKTFLSDEEKSFVFFIRLSCFL
jgi:hypothetical protein